MAESSNVTILRNKCVEIEHRISAYEREIEIARKNLVSVQMTLAVLLACLAALELEGVRLEDL